MLFKKQSSLSKNRMMICNRCQYKEMFAGKEICGLCGCVLKAKTEVEDEQCYDNRW